VVTESKDLNITTDYYYLPNQGDTMLPRPTIDDAIEYLRNGGKPYLANRIESAGNVKEIASVYMELCDLREIGDELLTSREANFDMFRPLWDLQSEDRFAQFAVREVPPRINDLVRIVYETSGANREYDSTYFSPENVAQADNPEVFRREIQSLYRGVYPSIQAQAEGDVNPIFSIAFQLANTYLAPGPDGKIKYTGDSTDTLAAAFRAEEALQGVPDNTPGKEALEIAVSPLIHYSPMVPSVRELYRS